MSLTSQQIVDNWTELLSIIENTFKGERKEKLLELYYHFEDRFLITPASGKTYYHGAYPGGLVEHTLNVINFAKQLYELWIHNGDNPNFTEEELIFSALNHDLGKIGDLDGPYFVEHNEKWRKDRGEIFIHNDKIRWMDVADRSLWLLQYFGVKYNQTEMLAIMLHDGLYDEANKSYLIAYTEGKQLRDNLPILLHQADIMATLIEKDIFINNKKQKMAEQLNRDVTQSKKLKSQVAVKIAGEFFKKDGE